MEIEKIYKLITSTNWEDRVIGASILDNMDDIEEFKEKYRAEDLPHNSDWGMHLSHWNCDKDAFYIEGKHGWYFLGSDMFGIDVQKNRNYWKRFETKESWK